MQTTFARVPAAIKPLPITKEFMSILSISSLVTEARTHRCVEHIVFYSCEVMQNISVKIWFLKKTTKNRIFGKYLLAVTIFLYSTMLIWVSPQTLIKCFTIRKAELFSGCFVMPQKCYADDISPASTPLKT